LRVLYRVSVVEAEGSLNRLQVRRAGTLTVVASFALIVLAACGGEPSLEEHLEDVTRVPTISDAAAQATREAPPPGASPEAGAGTPVSGDATPAGGEEAAPEAMTVEVVSQDIFFEPTEITIPANTDVTFVLPNEGVTAHNFSIDALGIDVDQAPETTEEVVINAPAGEYEFYCNVPGHKAAGMFGTLIVSEEAAAAAPAGVTTPAATPTTPAATPVAQEAVPAVEATPAPATEATPAAAEEAVAATAATSVEVVSYDIYFEPKEITILANTDVTFTLPNEGVTLHNFSIDELGIDIDQNPGETDEVVINAPAGTYEFYCNVPGHKAAGMVGTLIVTEDAAAAPADAAPADAATPAEVAQTAATPAAVTPAPAAGEAPGGEAAAETVEVVSLDIFFEPEAVTIPADTDVTFTLPNEGVTPHNFSIDELDIDVDQAPGETQEVVINAPAGTYEYYCNVPGHKAAGMVGTLMVE
jgi:plastocyanin